MEREHTVRTVVPVGDAVSRMVEIRLAASDSDWLVGSPVQVSLPADDPMTAIAVPRDALVERGGQSYLFRIDDDGKGYVDDIIEPKTTRPRLIRAFEMLETKQDSNPPKKHGNIPL